MLGAVVHAEQLLAHDGEDEDYDCQNEAEVAERAHRPPDDSDEQVESGPRLGQLEHAQLQQHTNVQCPPAIAASPL